MRRESAPGCQQSPGAGGALAPLWDCHARAPVYLTCIPPPRRHHHTLKLEDLAMG